MMRLVKEKQLRLFEYAFKFEKVIEPRKHFTLNEMS